MSRQGIREELVRFYEVFNAGGGLEAFRQFVAPGFVYRTRGEFPGGGTFTLEAALERVRSSEVLEDLRWEPQEFIDAGDRVVVVLRQVGRGRSSQAAIDNSVTHVWLIEADTATELHVYADRGEALAAAGLSE